MVKIKDRDILDAFKIEEKNPNEKVFHGILRNEDQTFIVFERNSGDSYTGFLEKLKFDLSSLSSSQIEFLKSKGYEI